MENASKALLIAGAILIVILLIAVGMMVYNSASGTIDKAIGSMSTTEKEIHNSQFEQYFGKNVRGSNVKNLINKVNANNGNGDNIKVTLHGVTNISDVSTSSNVSYTVIAATAASESDGYKNGVVTDIFIAEN